MRFDVISIFPDFFSPLQLSLMGKAKQEGIVHVQAHDLRDVTTDKHRTVDDTPYGGGAGMVMRADIWGRALDEVLKKDVEVQQPRRILAIPTPSGELLTQRRVEDLATASQIVIACGRYEGIDARVAQHYHSRDDVEVVEYSIGDYVLNGGESAALVLIEAVSRLLEGFMGNPDSLTEESHSGAGLLEYPAYTKPRSFRDLEVPAVLMSGNHEAVARWRRDRAIERTAAVRPDLAASLDGALLDGDDREMLAVAGYAYPREGRPSPMVIRPVQMDEVRELSELAQRTFPAACPPDLPHSAIEGFIREHLQEEHFAAFLQHPDKYLMLVADVDGHLMGYTHTHIGAGALDKEMVRPGRSEADDAYLSKCYVDSSWRGSGIAGALVEETVRRVRARGHERIVLGTNQVNKRAQKFYKRHGFHLSGRRTFDVGGVRNYDVIMVRDLTKLPN